MRAPLLKTYRQQICKFLERTYDVTPEKANEISMEICSKFYKPLTAIVEETKVDGKPEIRLWIWLLISKPIRMISCLIQEVSTHSHLSSCRRRSR